MSLVNRDAGAIDRRLHELNDEWDVERALEATAASVMLGGVALTATLNRKFLLLPAAAAAFLLQHVLQGWCPPLPVLRRLGFRTIEEIDQERFALRLLRGDFRNLPEEPASVLSQLCTDEQPWSQALETQTMMVHPTPGCAEGDRETIEAALAAQEEAQRNVGPIPPDAFRKVSLENRIQGG